MFSGSEFHNSTSIKFIELKHVSHLQWLQPTEHTSQCLLQGNAAVAQAAFQLQRTMYRSSSGTTGLSVYTGRSIPCCFSQSQSRGSNCTNFHQCLTNLNLRSMFCMNGTLQKKMLVARGLVVVILLLLQFSSYTKVKKRKLFLRHNDFVLTLPF